MIGVNISAYSIAVRRTHSLRLYPLTWQLASVRDIQQRSTQSQPDVKRAGFIAKYEDFLQQNYPRVHKVYHLFKQGTVDFIADTKGYYGVRKRIRRGEPLERFTRSELELYLQMPSDGLRILCIFIILQIPIVAETYFPLAYFFPRQLLCRHYWTPEQRVAFASLNLQKRVRYFDNVIRYLEQCVQRQSLRDTDSIRALIRLSDSGASDMVQEILAARSAFKEAPLALQSIPFMNRVNLSKSINLSIWRKRLESSSLILLHADKALIREGPENLTDAQLVSVCFLRGMSAANLSREQILANIALWLSISSCLSPNDVSLLIHLPALLKCHGLERNS